MVSMKRDLIAESGSGNVSSCQMCGTVKLTLLLMILRIQGQGNLAGADVQKLVFVVLRATELTDNLAEGIVLRGTQTW